jgi:hypothetical protein
LVRCKYKKESKTLNFYQIQSKLNLNNIFKSYLGYCDLEGLCNSSNYFERLRKKLFSMSQQLSLPTFFVTFTSTKRLWVPLSKVLHTLHASKLNLPNKIKDLQFVHVTKLRRIDLVTCARYYHHKTFCFCKLITKDHYLFGYISNFFSPLNSKIVGTNMTSGLLWIKKMHLCMECTQMKKLNDL